METISTLINNKTNKESQISILRFGILNKRQLGHREHPEPGPWSPKRPRTRGANDCWHAPKPKNISTLNIETRDFLLKKMFFSKSAPIALANQPPLGDVRPNLKMFFSKSAPIALANQQPLGVVRPNLKIFFLNPSIALANQPPLGVVRPNLQKNP